MLLQSKFIVILKGGIGNQLFQYAFAEYVKLATGKEAFVYYYLPGDPYRRDDVIRKIAPANHLPLTRANGIGLRVLFHRPENMLSQIIKGSARLAGYRFVKYKQPYDDKLDLTDYKNYLPRSKTPGIFRLDGYWQSAAMVNLVGNKLSQKLVNYPITDDAYRNLAKKLQEFSEAVGIHIRSNWYLGYSGDAAQLAKTHDQQYLAKSYYAKAVARIKAKGGRGGGEDARGGKGKPLFLVFADAPARAAELLDGILAEEEYVLVPNYADALKDYESLMLMSKCRSFILTNSTFGWWAAWFSWFRGGGADADAVYIMPAKWSKNANSRLISRGLVFAPQCELIDA